MGISVSGGGWRNNKAITRLLAKWPILLPSPSADASAALLVVKNIQVEWLWWVDGMH